MDATFSYEANSFDITNTYASLETCIGEIRKLLDLTPEFKYFHNCNFSRKPSGICLCVSEHVNRSMLTTQVVHWLGIPTRGTGLGIES